MKKSGIALLVALYIISSDVTAARAAPESGMVISCAFNVDLANNEILMRANKPVTISNQK